jgi:hypothetical protein
VILKGIDGSEFELSIVNYSITEIRPRHSQFDLNWLRVHAEAKTLQNSWDFTWSFMTTRDAERICKWFTDIIENKNVHPQIGCFEPELSLHLLGATIDHITLQAEYMYFVKEPKGWQHTYSTFQVTRDDLQLAAQQWCEEIKHFPRRAGF